MNDLQQLKVGDKIVDYGQVYRIFKIKKDRTLKENLPREEGWKNDK